MPIHYHNQCWFIVNSNLTNKHQWNINPHSYIFFQENIFETVIFVSASLYWINMSYLASFFVLIKNYRYNTFNSNRRSMVIFMDIIGVDNVYVTWIWWRIIACDNKLCDKHRYNIKICNQLIYLCAAIIWTVYRRNYCDVLSNMKYIWLYIC